MKFMIKSLICGFMLVGLFNPISALACDPVEDGCLGCMDGELEACVDQIVMEICDSGRSVDSCDRRRAVDDVERLILTTMGTHMARMRSLMRSAKRYQRR